jgi:hypothetical protein
LELLSEAMDMLEESKTQMALYRHQHYCDLRRRYDQLRALNEPLRKSLRETFMRENR